MVGIQVEGRQSQNFSFSGLCPSSKYLSSAQCVWSSCMKTKIWGVLTTCLYSRHNSWELMQSTCINNFHANAGRVVTLPTQKDFAHTALVLAGEIKLDTFWTSPSMVLELSWKPISALANHKCLLGSTVSALPGLMTGARQSSYYVLH